MHRSQPHPKTTAGLLTGVTLLAGGAESALADFITLPATPVQVDVPDIYVSQEGAAPNIWSLAKSGGPVMTALPKFTGPGTLTGVSILLQLVSGSGSASGEARAE